MEAIDSEKKTGGRLGLVIVVLALAHVVLYFAPNLYLPFDLDELFLLGYTLALADSSLVAFLGLKLLSLLRKE
ncbi:MAG: hypothetical protein EHM36_04190 [Deltaproteobacteria bacterium]|nr:MAG: hypothetical protein EHM36_04190 [Deltaproteobacteria bacterium]